MTGQQAERQRNAARPAFRKLPRASGWRRLISSANEFPYRDSVLMMTPYA